MFPLGSVLFPSIFLPLHVFEPRYRALVRDCLEGDREFGVVLIERGSEVGGGDARFSIATLAHVVSATELPDGRYALTAVGVARVRVERWLPDDPYPRAEISEITDVAPGPGARAAFDATVARLHEVRDLAARLQGLDEVPPLVLADDLEQASFEIAALAGLGPLDAQHLLEQPGTDARLAMLDASLADTASLLRARLGGA